VGLHEKNHKNQGQKCGETRINKGHFDKNLIRTAGIGHFQKKKKISDGCPPKYGKKKRAKYYFLCPFYIFRKKSKKF